MNGNETSCVTSWMLLLSYDDSPYRMFAAAVVAWNLHTVYKCQKLSPIIAFELLFFNLLLPIWKFVDRVCVCRPKPSPRIWQSCAALEEAPDDQLPTYGPSHSHTICITNKSEWERGNLTFFLVFILFYPVVVVAVMWRNRKLNTWHMARMPLTTSVHVECLLVLFFSFFVRFPYRLRNFSWLKNEPLSLGIMCEFSSPEGRKWVI